MVRQASVFWGSLLDSLGIALCIFDEADRTIHWNSTFLRFFPEHEGHVFVGEPYTDNLRRFYAGRLAGTELDQIERYIEEGLARHRQQMRPFSFTHGGRRLQVASLPADAGERVRIWQEIPVDGLARLSPTPTLTLDILEYFPDGVTVIDTDDAIIATNREFRRLYGLASDSPLVGERLGQVIERLWSLSDTGDADWHPTVLNNLRYTGAPFEIMLPGPRWLRVIARQTADGTRYVTHSDISILKRQYQELKDAELRARTSEQALKLANDKLAAMAATDEVTGLANRRHFDERLQLEWKRARRAASSISVLMIDIDHFKMINDQFGHIVGDACLRQVADMIRKSISRPADVAARYGGDEFAVLLPDTDLSGARQIAEGMRANIRIADWTSIATTMQAPTLSIGIYTGENNGKTLIQDLIREADALLYRAKTLGRNRIEHPIISAAQSDC